MSRLNEDLYQRKVARAAKHLIQTGEHADLCLIAEIDELGFCVPTFLSDVEELADQSRHN